MLTFWAGVAAGSFPAPGDHVPFARPNLLRLVRGDDLQDLGRPILLRAHQAHGCLGVLVPRSHPPEQPADGRGRLHPAIGDERSARRATRGAEHPFERVERQGKEQLVREHRGQLAQRLGAIVDQGQQGRQHSARGLIRIPGAEPPVGPPGKPDPGPLFPALLMPLPCLPAPAKGRSG